MSWSLSFEVVDGEIVDKDKVIKEYQRLGELVEQHKNQIGVGVGAALGILESGAFGSIDKTYSVSMSGHGNPDHEPLAGWANDSLTINIWQKTMLDTSGSCDV